jgi:hypothetical protein
VKLTINADEVMDMLVRMRTGDFSWGASADEYSIFVYREYTTQ